MRNGWKRAKLETGYTVELECGGEGEGDRGADRIRTDDVALVNRTLCEHG